MTRLSLPSPAKIKATHFRLQRVQAINPLRGGHHQAVDLGEPVWVCEISTAPLSRAQGGAWKALLAKLRGALRTLMLHDVSRPRPLAYADATDSAVRIGRSVRIGEPRRIGGQARAWGAPRIVSIDRANGRMRIDGLVSGATLSEGDYLAWDDGPARRLHMIVEAAVADNLGQSWVTIEPAPPLASAHLPAAAELDRASAEFGVTDSSAPYSAPVIHEATLQAVQVLRRS